MKNNVQLEAVYPHPPERVWQALTDADALGQWLMPTDFKPLIGFRFRLNQPDGTKVEGKVTEVEEARRLAYTWKDEDDGEGSLVVWTLEPKDGGTRVCIHHVPIEEPAVTCLSMDLYFNWRYALRKGLPHALRMLAMRIPPPIVYVDESKDQEKEKVAK